MRNVPLGGNGTLRISTLHDAAGTILSDDGAACLLSSIGKATRCSSSYAGVKSSAKKRDVKGSLKRSAQGVFSRICGTIAMARMTTNILISARKKICQNCEPNQEQCWQSNLFVFQFARHIVYHHAEFVDCCLQLFRRYIEALGPVADLIVCVNIDAFC